MLYRQTDFATFKSLIEYNLRILQSENLDITMFECSSGDISRCRADAAETGTSPYFGWIDCDDVILRGAYPKLFQAIQQQDKPFAWMNERIVMVDENQVEIYRGIRKIPHHIHLIHKDIVDFKYLRVNPDRQRPDAWIQEKMPQGIHVDEIGYIWRRRTDGLSIRNFTGQHRPTSASIPR